MDLHPRLQQRPIHRARCVVLHEVFITPLQQQAHPHAPAGRHQQGLAQLAARHEVGVGDDDLVPRGANRTQVGLFNTGAVANVVAQHQGCAHFGTAAAQLTDLLLGMALGAGGAQRLQGFGQAALAHIAHGLHAPPQLLHGIAGLHHQAAGGAHRKVKAGGVQRTVVGVVKIIEHVDAAAKQHPPVHHAQLAVQAPPAAGQQQAQSAQGGVHPPLHTGRSEAGSPEGRQAAGAYAVHHQMRAHAALRRTGQRFAHAAARAGEVEDVGFKLNVRQGCIHGLDQRREQLLCALVQAHIVVVRKLRRGTHGRANRPRGSTRTHQSRNSAISGKWSDMRHQMRPRGTCRLTGVRPRAYTWSSCASGNRAG